MQAENAVIDGRRFRDVLGHYPTGVALVTAIGPDGEPVGMIVGSFTSVSLEPPLVAFLPTLNSYTFGLIREATSHCINVLAADQEDLCRHFASRAEDKWAGVEWRPSPSGAPILEDAVAWIDCSLDSVTEAGDHYVAMGRVHDLGIERAVAPLLFFQGGYGRFTMSSVVVESAPDLVSAIKLAELARSDVEDFARRGGINCDIVAPVGSDLVFMGAATSTQSSQTGPSLGTRIPLMAPLGEQYIAWMPQEDIDGWIARSGITSEEAVEALLERLRVARERGWSLSRIAADDELPFYEAQQQYVSGDLTPAAERNLRARIAQWSDRYAPIDVELNLLYDAHSISVPVHGRDGKPLLILRASNLPRPSTGAQVLAWIEDLQRAALLVSARIEPANWAPLHQLHGWG